MCYQRASVDHTRTIHDLSISGHRASFRPNSIQQWLRASDECLLQRYTCQSYSQEQGSFVWLQGQFRTAVDEGFQASLTEHHGDAPATLLLLRMQAAERKQGSIHWLQLRYWLSTTVLFHGFSPSFCKDSCYIHMHPNKSMV